MGTAYRSDIFHSKSIDICRKGSKMAKLWEFILICVLVGMFFILRLDRKKNPKDKSNGTKQGNQRKDAGKQRNDMDETNCTK